VALYRVTVEVPGWGRTTFLYDASTPEEASARAARLFGPPESVEALGRLESLRTRPSGAVRAEVLTALRDFIAAVGRWREPLARSLEAMPPRVREVVARLLAATDAGAGLGEALRTAGFPDDEARLIEAGERTGALVRMIDVALQNLSVRARLASTVRSAAFYPALTVMAVGGVGAVFRFAVLPGIAKVFAELEAPVPWTLTVAPTVMMALPAAVALVVFLAWTQPALRDRLVALPGARTFFWLLDNLSVFQALRAAHAAGTGTARALEEAADLCRTERARTACRRLGAWLRGDPGPVDPDDPTGGRFRDFQAAAVAAGFEGDFAFIYGAGLESGRAEEALGGLIERYERRLNEHAKRLERAVEVGLLLVVGVLVGVTVATFYSTIYSLISKFG